MTVGNRVLLRLARRSISTSPLRSLLVIALIAVVVATGTGVAVAVRSATPTVQDQARARFGSSDTLITVGPGTFESPPTDRDHPVLVDGEFVEPLAPTYAAAVQGLIADQQRGLAWLSGFEPARATAALEAALETEVLVSRQAELGTTGGPYQRRPAFQEITDIDMANPLADGLFELIDGRFPLASSEIAIAAADNNFAEFAVGDQVTLDRVTLDVVGLITKPSGRYGRGAVVTPIAFDMLTIRDNTVLVEIRAVFGDDPSRSVAAVERELGWVSPGFYTNDEQYGFDTDYTDPAIRVVPALVSSVLGIQLALVAAAAFAVGVRRRTKEFGQLMTTGMDGNQLRRMVLFEAVWLGVIGAIVGVVIGFLAVSQAISWGWLNQFGQRYVNSARWNVIDWLAPAGIGLISAVGAAWWPARSVANAPVTAALAGHLPAGRPNDATPRWGVLAVIVGALCVAGLAASSSADQRSLTFTVVFIAAVTATFVGTLLFIGSMLSAINQWSGRFPLLARLIVRSSDRHRSRSWMVIGAFIATLALPVLVSASFKAYPESSSGASEFDRRLLTARSEAPDIELPLVSIDADLTAEVAGFVSDLDQAIAAEFELVGSVTTKHLPYASLNVTRDGHWSRGYGAGASVMTPALVELLGIPAELSRQVEGDTALYLGTESLVSGSFELAQQPRDGLVWTEVSIELIDGPDISNYEHNILISPELAAKLGDTFRTSTLYVFTEPLSSLEEEALFERVNGLWVDRFGAYGYPTPSTMVTPELQVQEWVRGQTDIRLQRTFQNGPTRARLRWGALALSGLLASMIALVTASLAAVELDAELQSMIATGAAPRTRRLVLGGQTLYHLLLAAALGIPLALLLFYAVSRADDWGPTTVTIPWVSIALSSIVIPTVVAAIVAATFRNGRPAVSRRLS